MYLKYNIYLLFILFINPYHQSPKTRIPTYLNHKQIHLDPVIVSLSVYLTKTSDASAFIEYYSGIDYMGMSTWNLEFNGSTDMSTLICLPNFLQPVERWNSANFLTLLWRQAVPLAWKLGAVKFSCLIFLNIVSKRNIGSAYDWVYQTLY